MQHLHFVFASIGAPAYPTPSIGVVLTASESFVASGARCVTTTAGVTTSETWPPPLRNGGSDGAAEVKRADGAVDVEGGLLSPSASVDCFLKLSGDVDLLVPPASESPV